MNYNVKKSVIAFSIAFRIAGFSSWALAANQQIIGDINYDSIIDITDLTELSLALLGDMELTADGKKAADVDNDDAVTLADLAKLRQFLSKKIPSLDDAGISDKSAPNTSEPTGVVFEVRSLAKYAELKDALTKNDEELEKFFSTIGGGKKDRETASVFVEYVDSLSLLDFLPGKIIWIHYDKRDSYETVQVTVESDSGEWIRYQYNLSDNQTTLTNTAVNKTTVLDNPVQNDDGSIILFSKSERPHTSGIGEMISIYGKINGIDVNIVYRTLDSANFSLDNFLSSKLVKIDDFTKYENEVKPIENHNTTVYSSTFNTYFELSENIVKTLSYWEEVMTQDKSNPIYVSRLMFKAEDLNYIKVPKFADNDLKLIDSDGIVLNSKDLYERPALIFNYDNNVSVKLTDVENERIDFDQVDTSAFIEKMNSICEDKELLPLYDDVRVEKTEIKGRTAEVLFGSNKGDSNVYAVFVYDDYLVTLCCSQEDIESGLLSSFRLKELELSEQINSDVTNSDNTNVVDAKDILLIGYDDKTNSESTEKLPRIALKCNSFSNPNELFDVDIALGDESFSTEDFNNGVIYSQEIYVCDPVNYKDIHDEKFYVNNVNSKYQMEYSKGEIKVFNISERYNDYDSYRHVTASLDFSKYNVGDCGIINFEFTKYFADTTYIQDRKFIYFFVGENGVYLSGTGIEDAKKASQTT